MFPCADYCETMTQFAGFLLQTYAAAGRTFCVCVGTYVYTRICSPQMFYHDFKEIDGISHKFLFIHLIGM
jgi:hypothetical protein